MDTSYQEILTAQRQFFDSGQTRPISFRITQLDKLKKLIHHHQKEIIKALMLDLHKCEAESLLTEVLLIIREIDFVLKNVKKWIKPTRVSTPFPLQPGRSFVCSAPYGCVLIIAPWNYPMMLCLSPLIGAMAAGNCAVIKPSPLARHSEQLIAKLVSIYFDQKYITVITGDADSVQSLLQEKWDYIFFTGSPKVGKIVMQAAALHLTPITLELGGKSPCIVDESANLPYAAKRIIWAKMLNAGQSCIAPDYLYVHAACKEKLVEQMKVLIKQFYGDNPFYSESFGRIINKQHVGRIKKILQKSYIICGGEVIEEEHYVAPTLLDQVTWEDPIMQEEIFAPILPILTFEKLEEVINIVKQQPASLALYLFTRNKNNENKILSSLTFGNASINDCLLQMVNLSLPFGGVSQSGMGQYHGKHSFDSFSYPKSIYKRMLPIDVPFIYPPYYLKKMQKIKILLTPWHYAREILNFIFK